jgi:hypothetical protein
MTKRQVSKSLAMGTLPLLDEIRELIDAARTRAVLAVYAELTLMYWRIGQHIRVHVLLDQRARYGEEILATLSQELAIRYGSGFRCALPLREVLAERLQHATARAQQHIEHRASAKPSDPK